MKIKFIDNNLPAGVGIGTGLEGVFARVGEVIDHPLDWAARMLIARGHAVETEEPTSVPANLDYEEPSGRLTDVDGIGQITAAQLARAGIATLRDLAEATAADVARAAGGKSATHVRSWINEARELLGLTAISKDVAGGADESDKPDAG